MSKFYRGKATLFDPAKHKDGLFFATDINELYVALNETDYRVYGSKEIITNIALEKNTGELVITYRDKVIPVNPDSQNPTYTNVAKLNLVDLMVKASSTTAGLMSATDKSNLDELVLAYENNELGKVQGLADGETILDLSEEGLLSATVKLDYDEDAQEIRLLDKNNNVIGTAISTKPFLVDGMLNDVEVVTDETDGKKYIEFTWNVTTKTEVEGEEVETTKTDRIAIEDIVVAYTAGNGIEISNSNVVSVKAGNGIEVDATGVNVKANNGITVNSNGVSVKAGDGIFANNSGVSVDLAIGTGDYISSSDKNFLNFTAEKKLTVRGVTTDCAVLNEPILVAGLPTSGIGSGIYKNGQTIEAGTSIYEILSNLLSKEDYPSSGSGKVSGPTFKTTYATPSFTVKQGSTDVNGKTVEVGTVVTISSVSGTAPSASGTRSYSGFTNGYATVDGNGDATIVKNQNPPSVDVVASANVSAGTFTLSRSFSEQNFGQTTGSNSSKNNYSECSIASMTASVKEGSNKVTCTMTGPVHTGTIAASPKYYVLSNKFNYKDVTGYFVAAQAANNNMTATVSNGSSTKTVTGAFYYYIGYVDAVPTNIPVTGDSENHATAAIKGLDDIAANWCVSTGNTITTGGTLPGGKNMCIAVPSHYALDSIMNGFDLESKDSFTTTSVKYKLGDGTYQDYTIYSMNSAADWNFKTIKLKKA